MPSRRRLVFCCALAVLAALALPSAAGAAHDTTLVLPALSAPVRIVTDRFGIPHLRAQSLPDLYVAWGFVSARERLWQMVAMRQSVKGQMWRWCGNRTLQDDGGAQLFEMRAVAERIWERSRRDPAVAVPLERYAAGVNAYLALCRSGARPWPVELARLRARPGDWSPADAVSVLLGMGALLDLALPELAERDSIARHGPGWIERRRRFESQWIYDTIPDSAARRLYGDGAAGARLEQAPAAEVPPRLLAAARARLGRWASPAAFDPDLRASNVFAVGPRRSAGHAALLANDPHLGLTAPGSFWLIHVSVPGVLEAAGACVPGWPAIVSGRNQRVAWGITALGMNVLDVYADSLSRDGRKVRWRGRWEPLREKSFDLCARVLGIPVPVGLFGQVRRYSPHGPVVALDRRRRVALSVRWAGLSDSVNLAPLLGTERARTAAEACAAFRALVTPTLNVVAADRDGHVRYQAAGLVPRRGFLPPRGALPGDGRWEWQGFIPAGRMPAWEAPPGGFIVNANNRPVGPAYFEPLPGFDWAHDRALRIAGRLAGDPSVTVADLRSVQNDVTSRAAQRVLPVLIACADSLPERLDRRARAALDTLRAWDLAARRDRVAPTLFRAWVGALQRRSGLDGVPGLMLAALDGRAPEALRAPRGGAPERAAVAAPEALKLALAKLEKLLGPDLSRWRYGRAHRARFPHRLGEDLKEPSWAPPPVPVDGDNSTPSVGASRLPWSPFVTHGPVFRHLVDVAVTDSSWIVIPPGNSGDLRSPHARDHLERWAGHGYVPLYLAWERIEATKESVVTLAPGGR